jgi:16S rRNA (guanine(966)-N(2))-methyltransferase RsmD
MRVIGGEFRSRRLISVPGEATRPTPDRLRETLFDILQPRIGGSIFLDAYAGTGAVGIEALSRGARHVYFLEKNRVALDAIRENLAALKVGSRATVLTGPVALTLSRWIGQVDAPHVVFADPPYDLEREYSAILAELSSNPPELTILQHSIRFALPEAPGLRHTRNVRQGENVLSFYVSAATTMNET